MTLKVSIGVCVRNSESTIDDTITGLLCQDFPHEQMEIIFVDDGSTDNTLSIIEKYVERLDIRTQVFSRPWKGLGETRNLVVENAKGTYIIWVDGDTILDCNYVRKQIQFMDKHPRVGIATGRFNFNDFNNIVAFLEHMSFEAVTVKNRGYSGKLPGTAGAIYRLDAVKQVSGFDPAITGAGEDTDIAYRIKLLNWLIYWGISAFCFTKRKNTWKSLWKQYQWHGYGYHYVYNKHNGISKLWDMLPLIAFFSGLINSFVAFKLTSKKSVFLLPIHFVFKSCAWWLGFIKSHFASSL